MANKQISRTQQNKFLKLSLRKNKLKLNDVDDPKLNRSSDVIILDESFEKMRLEFPKRLDTKTYSPIVINDSSESDDELPRIDFPMKQPSLQGNVSFNCSMENPSPTKELQPSIGGWSPAQHIITATPRHETVPTTPKDVANESYEQCSIKKIQLSQKKILSDLYGETWKSIPKLFKTVRDKYENYDAVTRKLFDEDESDKENIREDLKRNRELYLTGSDVKRKKGTFGDMDKKSKKKLYTEKVPSTPDVTKQKTKVRNVNSTTKKTKIKKGMSVTELVQIMKNDAEEQRDNVDKTDNVDISTKKEKKIVKNSKLSKIEALTKRIENVMVTPEVKRLSFVGSLADNIPSWRCHPEAIQYRDNYKNLREQLTGRLYSEFNRSVFEDALDADMLIQWDTKLRSTAGTTTNRLIKTANSGRIRSSSIKLSTKVLDTPARLRDTLIHELCHAATWLVDAELRAGHGPLWKKWASRALRVYPELGEISRCHDMEIHFKYSYRCTKCGYSIQRHSKSIDVTKKCCGYCRGTFEVVVNKKNKDGVIVKTPARKGAPNGFAQYVKENYATTKDGSKTHAQVMKMLGEQFSAKKKTKNTEENADSLIL